MKFYSVSTQLHVNLIILTTSLSLSLSLTSLAHPSTEVSPLPPATSQISPRAPATSQTRLWPQGAGLDPPVSAHRSPCDITSFDGSERAFKDRNGHAYFFPPHSFSFPRVFLFTQKNVFRLILSLYAFSSLRIQLRCSLPSREKRKMTSNIQPSCGSLLKFSDMMIAGHVLLIKVMTLVCLKQVHTFLGRL